MQDYNELYDTVIDTFKKILYPEEWIAVDMFLSKTELFTLLQVERNGEIIMSQIADFISIPMSTATGMVERLVKKGYIERVRNDSDRRIVTIRLTDAGKKLTGDIKSVVMNMVKVVMDDLTEQEQALLYKLFFKVTDFFSEKKSIETETTGSVVKKIEIE